MLKTGPITPKAAGDGFAESAAESPLCARSAGEGLGRWRICFIAQGKPDLPACRKVFSSPSVVVVPLMGKDTEPWRAHGLLSSHRRDSALDGGKLVFRRGQV